MDVNGIDGGFVKGQTLMMQPGTAFSLPDVHRAVGTSIEQERRRSVSGLGKRCETRYGAGIWNRHRIFIPSTLTKPRVIDPHRVHEY